MQNRCRLWLTVPHMKRVAPGALRFDGQTWPIKEFFKMCNSPVTIVFGRTSTGAKQFVQAATKNNVFVFEKRIPRAARLFCSCRDSYKPFSVFFTPWWSLFNSHKDSGVMDKETVVTVEKPCDKSQPCGQVVGEAGGSASSLNIVDDTEASRRGDLKSGRTLRWHLMLFDFFGLNFLVFHSEIWICVGRLMSLAREVFRIRSHCSGFFRYR